MCYALGRVCSSTAMIFAMHQTKVACLVRHGAGSAYHEALMRRVASEQMLLASSTTEGQNGGNIRFSSAAVEHAGTEISLVRNATVISYGAQADGIVTIARRDNDAAGSDQVLLAITKDDYTLERSVEWETLGMRGTCSAGFELKFKGSSEQIFPEGYDKIHAQTMTPVAHLCWSSAWAGIAAASVERAQAFIRKAARGAGGQMPPGAAHFNAARMKLAKLRAIITANLDHYAAHEHDERALSSIDFQSSINLLKVEASELAVETVMSAMRACGLAGYRNDGDFSIGRLLRDVLVVADHDQQRPHPRQHCHHQPHERGARKLARLNHSDLITPGKAEHERRRPNRQGRKRRTAHRSARPPGRQAVSQDGHRWRLRPDRTL